MSIFCGVITILYGYAGHSVLIFTKNYPKFLVAIAGMAIAELSKKAMKGFKIYSLGGV